MRILLIATLCAATLVVAAPVSAQRASLADRVAALEAHGSDNSATLDLLNRVNQLTAEVQALRAQVEELQHAQEQARDTSRVQYLDLDGRLERLEGGAPAAAPAANTAPAATRPATAPRPAPAAVPAADARADSGTLPQGTDEAGAYRVAFGLLQAGRYADASRAFNEFLARWPSGAYAANALYWLGESYYVTQNYAFALEQFQAVRQRYPQHDKAAGALLKTGMAHHGLRQLDQAERDYRAVVEQYPGSDVARIADERLRALQLQRLR